MKFIYLNFEFNNNKKFTGRRMAIECQKLFFIIFVIKIMIGGYVNHKYKMYWISRSRSYIYFSCKWKFNELYDKVLYLITKILNNNETSFLNFSLYEKMHFLTRYDDSSTKT